MPAKGELSPSGWEHRLSYLAESPAACHHARTGGSANLASKAAECSRRHAFGRAFTPSKLQECFNCHATLTSTVARNRLEISTLVAQRLVRRRCHGPGRDPCRRGAGGERPTFA